MPRPTMFERYGGPGKTSEVVLAFYDRVLASARLAPFFRHSDMRRLLEHQAKYLSTVMGGPASYTEAELRDLHGHLRIAGADFEEMLQHLRAVLVENGFADSDVAHVTRRYAGLRSAIVTRS